VSTPLLRMDGVGVSLPRHGTQTSVLEDFSLTLETGQMLALVGESGSGKTVAAHSIPRLLPAGAIVSGTIRLGGQTLTNLPEAAIRRLRGRRIGMVFQDPLAALNPSHSVGAQIAEPMGPQLGLSRRDAWARAVELLAEVGIAEPALRARHYPHQFSGGMRQRVLVAMALACGPDLLIADEPTTGLDAALKTQMLDLLGRLRRERRLAVLLVSHDLALVRRHADTVQVLYAGRTVERGAAARLFAAPRHPYTHALLLATPVFGRVPVGIAGQLPEPEMRPPGCRFAPRCARADPACDAAFPSFTDGGTQAACLFPLAALAAPAPPPTLPRAPPCGPVLLRARGISVRYGGGLLDGHAVTAVADADLSLAEGECLALVGPSGSGKTSLGRAVLQMVPYQGDILLRDVLVGALRGAARRRVRRRIGAVFQDPAGSLTPTMTVGALIGEALKLGGEYRADARRRRAATLLESVRLPASLLDRLPATLSGGQAQRVAIARALAAEPDLLVLDEPTSSLDVSSQAVILNLLSDLSATRGLSLIIITHDIDAVGFLAHRMIELRNGRIVQLPPVCATAAPVPGCPDRATEGSAMAVAARLGAPLHPMS
jgi:oligopeptide/dipeptide ABC transporter ATP-binding protein